MRLACMQPYFFPYIGYWQLIHAADLFVLFDDAQYMKKHWVNRNRILKPGGGWQYIVAPVGRHAVSARIRDVLTVQEDWRALILRQTAHYARTAQYFAETNAILEDVLLGSNETTIGAFNCMAVTRLCGYLDIRTRIVIASAANVDYSEIHGPGDWALQFSAQLGASEYINPVAGSHLFDQSEFLARGIRLSFLKGRPMDYFQPGEFEPALSIIDVLMFNGVQGTKRLIDDYLIETSSG